MKEGGWPGIDMPEEYGGQGMPYVMNTAVGEMFSAANQAFTMYQGLTHGALGDPGAWHGGPEADTYLPKMVACDWTGTMNLTEPHCGTDLGLMRTKAEPQDDGSYKITGQKIFISAGEHDMADNIIHLVLAKIPGGPEGIKGVSLFIVPKFLVNDDGSARAAQRRVLRQDRRKDGHPRQCHLRDELRRATGYLWARRTRACARCSP
jgi:alkylation response protein AidB-like acyl-CoA dehydrogenase